jgi:hypothetical protein
MLDGRKVSVSDPFSSVKHGSSAKTEVGNRANRHKLGRWRTRDPGTGELVDDEQIQTALPAGVTAASSGAVPGFANCQAVLAAVQIPGTTCVPSEVKPSYGTGQVVAVTTPGGDQTMVQLGQPLLAVPEGTVVSYDAVITAGWTSARPVLPPAADQYDAATQGKG